MPEYDEPAAYTYASRRNDAPWDLSAAEIKPAAYHPECLVAEMIDRQELSPAARDMPVEVVLNQHAGANGIVREDGLIAEGPTDPQYFPQSEWPNNALAEQGCGRCAAPILPALPPITAVQHVARDLAASDLAMDRNDYDPEWCSWADRKFGATAEQHIVAHEALLGATAEQHIVAHEALRQYRETEQITDWALTGAQATEALNRPRTPDSIEALRARLAEPVQLGQEPQLHPGTLDALRGAPVMPQRAPGPTP